MFNINSVEFLRFITLKWVHAFSNFGNESAFTAACGMVELQRGDQVRRMVLKGGETAGGFVFMLQQLNRGSEKTNEN